MARLYLFLVLFILNLNLSFSQSIKMRKEGGVYIMPCKVNGLELNFIFDTGASNVSISLTEAIFMIKNGYISESDLYGSEYYRIANGEIQEGTRLILRKIEIGGRILTNVEASIVHSLDAPLLLGQSALSKLGKIEFDYGNNTLTINSNSYSSSPSSQNNSYSSSSSGSYSNSSTSNSNYSGSFIFQTTFIEKSPIGKIPLRSSPDINGRVIFECPLNSKVYVLSKSNDVFIRVHVNGYTGYVSKAYLIRQQ